MDTILHVLAIVYFTMGSVYYALKLADRIREARKKLTE